MARISATRESIAVAALAFVDDNGVEALTLRALGKQTGFHHTAVYRHFRDRNDVLSAVYALVVDECLQGVVPLPDDPEERLLALIRGLRSAMHRHPAVTVAYLLPFEALADSEAVATYVSHVLTALGELGLEGRDRLVHYRILESYALGASVFDFGGAPAHLESRRQRMRHVPDQAFEAVTRDVGLVDELNEEAFDRGLVLLVTECARVGALEK